MHLVFVHYEKAFEKIYEQYQKEGAPMINVISMYEGTKTVIDAGRKISNATTEVNTVAQQGYGSSPTLFNIHIDCSG